MLRRHPTASVFDVFTPTTQATLNFVARDASLDKTLADALATPGKQIVVYGESGSGKSTLLVNSLSKWVELSGYITTQCVSSTSFDQLLLDAFDQLNPFYQDSRGTSATNAVNSSVGASFHVLRASIDANVSSATDTSHKRVLPPQLTPQRLGEFLGAQNLCWIIEDFHKMKTSEKRPLEELAEGLL